MGREFDERRQPVAENRQRMAVAGTLFRDTSSVVREEATVVHDLGAEAEPFASVPTDDMVLKPAGTVASSDHNVLIANDRLDIVLES